jgi:hypothetical protein
MSRHRKSRVLARLAHIGVLLALLAGWQSALLHPIGHVDERGAFVHPNHDHSRSGKSSDPSAQLCDALAALTACAFAPLGNLAVVSGAGIALGLQKPGPLLAASAPPFFAQAPPSFL